jgi:Uma2 family endonuclease
MATTTGLMTVERFRALPDPPGGHYELHHGELVFVSGPKYRHWDIQDRLLDLLKPLAKGYGRLGAEFGFRPLAEHEYWQADVAFISAKRIAAVDPNDNLYGAPDIVIGVISPSNTIAQMDERKSLCLDNGGQEFWVVDPKRNTVRVSKPNEVPKTYRVGDQIPLPLFGDARISVDAIFESLE